MSACRSCGAEIIWATSERSGKAMPLDAKPVAEAPDSGPGLFAIVRGVAHAYTAKDASLHRDAHTSHFSSCPHADQWRGAGR